MPGCGFPVSANHLSARRDPFTSNRFALGVVFREICPVKTRTAELPRGFRVVGAGLKSFSRLLEVLFRALGEDRSVFRKAKPVHREQANKTQAPTAPWRHECRASR